MTVQDQPSTDEKRTKVLEIINSVVSKVEANDTISKEAIFYELKSLEDIILDVRKDLTQTGANQIGTNDIPTATDELDAVVEATAEASGTIMDSCEAIQGIATGLDAEKAALIEAEVTKIFEACSFQDITGQRITKVVSTLKEIEVKVGSLLSILADKMPGVEYTTTPATEAVSIDDPDSLMNGPQLPGQGITQQDIDALLDDLFD